MKSLVASLTLILLTFLAGCNRDPKEQSRRYVETADKYYSKGQVKQASIMYRRALQKDMKNARAWYQLGEIDMHQSMLGEGRVDLIRVSDLAETSGKFDDMTRDALVKIADIDYTGYSRYADKLKDYYSDLKKRAELLTKNYPNTFDSWRVAGLVQYASTVGVKKREDRLPAMQTALEDFQKADRLKPYDPTLGFALITALAETGHVEESQKYANEMIARKKADDRVYAVVYWYDVSTRHPDEAEAVRKLQVANNPTSGSAYISLASHYHLAHKKAEMDDTIKKLTSDPKTFPNGYMLAGDFYFSINDLATAIPLYEQGAKTDTANKSAYLKKTAEAYTLLGKQDEANKLIAELLKIDPNDPETVAMDASNQLRSGKREDAEKVIARLEPLLAKTSPTQAERTMILHFNLGRAYALRGDVQSLDQARQHLEAAVKARETERVPYIPALMALSELELVRGSNPQAIDYSTRILRYDPMNLNAWLVRTQGLANEGEKDKARAELNAILKAKPDSLDAHFQLGRLEESQKHFPEAEEQYNVLRKANDPRGLGSIIECRVQQGKGDDAIGLLQGELKNNPNNTNYRNALGILYFNLGRPADAAAEFKKLIDLNPNTDPGNREGWYLRMGEALRLTKDNDGAMAAFTKASEIAPKHAAPRLEMGLLDEEEGKTDQARQIYEQVLKIDPDNAIALNNLAYDKVTNGSDLDGAMALAQKARKKAPQDPNVLDTLGLIYFKKNLLDDSMRIFTDLVGKSPKNPTFRIHLAMALVQKGDKARARRELDQASHNGPSGREQTQIHDLMSKIG